MAELARNAVLVDAESYTAARSYFAPGGIRKLTVDVEGGTVYLATSDSPHLGDYPFPERERRLRRGFHGITFAPPIFNVRFRAADAGEPATIYFDARG